MRASLFISLAILTLTYWGSMSERRSSLNVRERDCYCREIILIFSSFTVLVLILSLKKLQGFLLYGFPEENSLCLLSLVMCLCFIVVHVILLVKDPKIIMLAYMMKN